MQKEKKRRTETAIANHIKPQKHIYKIQFIS